MKAFLTILLICFIYALMAQNSLSDTNIQPTDQPALLCNIPTGTEYTVFYDKPVRLIYDRTGKHQTNDTGNITSPETNAINIRAPTVARSYK